MQFYFPITIAAKTKNSLEKEGYYCDNENWKIEYDINFHYLIDEILNESELLKEVQSIENGNKESQSEDQVQERYEDDQAGSEG